MALTRDPTRPLRKENSHPSIKIMPRPKENFNTMENSHKNILLSSNNLLDSHWEECHSIARSLETDIIPPKEAQTLGRGKVISINDLPTKDFHLICQRFSNGRTLEKEFSIYVKKTETNSTDLNIYAVGGLRIAAFNSKDWSYIGGCATERSVKQLENGWVLISVKYTKTNNDIFIGCSLGLRGRYKGKNQKQFYLYFPQLKWVTNDYDHIRDGSENNRIKLLDIGASGGLQKHWTPLMHSMDFYMVEPSPQGLEKLKKLYSKYENIKLLPYALGKKSEKNELFVTRNCRCSSLRKPNWNLLKFYPVKKRFEIVKKENVECYRYDELVAAGKAPVPQFVKIDVQGYEFEVLVGFGKLLHEVLAIELESHFYPIYEGQKSLMEIVNYLYEYDLILRKLEPHGPFEGDLVEVNAFFTKRKNALDTIAIKHLELWEQICKIPKGRKLRNVRS